MNLTILRPYAGGMAAGRFGVGNAASAARFFSSLSLFSMPALKNYGGGAGVALGVAGRAEENMNDGVCAARAPTLAWRILGFRFLAASYNNRDGKPATGRT